MSSIRFPSVRGRLAGLLACAVMFQASVATAQTESGDEPFDLVFFGPDGAVFLRLNVLGGSVLPVRREYTASVLRQLDADGDGALNADEAMQIPADGQGGTSSRLGENWRSIDINPPDGAVSEDELFEFINNALGAPFRVEIKANLEQTVTLHSELDANDDGKVSQSEIENGLASLRQFDFDDDETLSIGELQPFPTAIRQSQRQAVQSGESPIAALYTAEQRELAHRRLLSLYGDEATGAIAPERLGLREAESEGFDANGDGRFDSVELTEFLKSPVPSLALDCSLSPSRVAVNRRVRPSPLVGMTDIRSAQFTFAGTDVSVSASNAVSGRISDTDVAVSFYLVKFIEVDTDKNLYLNPSEFAAIGIPRTDFQAVDVDGDGMIVRQELKDYLELFAALQTRATLVVTVANKGTTLFKILETSLDFRLSPRELREGFTHVAQFDLNRDGALAPSELQERYTLEVSLAKPEFLLNLFENAAMQNPQQIEGIRRPRTSGPGWFRKMDRNQDGDLTWREFFGTRQDFTEIDTDGDGLIGLNEAMVVEYPQ